jgi:hypothetical protein
MMIGHKALRLTVFPSLLTGMLHACLPGAEALAAGPPPGGTCAPARDAAAGAAYKRALQLTSDKVLAAAWARRDSPRRQAQGRTQRAASPCPELAEVRQRLAPAPARRAQATAEQRRQVESLVQKLAPEYALKPDLVLAVIAVESNFDPKARSIKNAQGLMQLIPATARRFGVSNPWDPGENIRGGMAYIRWLLDHFDGNLRFALAAYNAGEGAVQRHGGVPPYRETRAYIKRIAERLSVSEDELELLAADEEPELPAQAEPAPESAAAETVIPPANYRRHFCGSRPGGPILAGRTHSGGPGAIGRCDG